MEEAFLWFKIEVVELHDFENVMDCALVVHEVGVSGNSDVVHVDSDRCSERFMFENNIAVDVVHHGLECHMSLVNW